MSQKLHLVFGGNGSIDRASNVNPVRRKALRPYVGKESKNEMHIGGNGSTIGW